MAIIRVENPPKPEERASFAQRCLPDPGAMFWRLPAVRAYTQRSRSALYRDPTFPKPVPLGPRTSAWVASEVIAWATQQIAKRNAGGVA